MSGKTLQGPATVLGAYSPGETLLHKMPAAVKVLGLLVTALTIGVFRSPAATAGALIFAAAIAFVSRVSARDMWRMLRGFLLVLLILFGFHWWFNSALHAFTVVGALLSLLLLASLMTATTRVADLIDTFTSALRPLRMFGVNPDAVALALSLVITTIPILLIIFRQTREAAWARGLQNDPRAIVVPFVTRTIAHALTLGEALSARGVTED